VIICLTTTDMRATAVRLGINEPLYMDATHGLQKYGLKLVTVHVKDEEGKGMITRCFRICSQHLQRAHDGTHTRWLNSQADFANLPTLRQVHNIRYHQFIQSICNE
jgi:hypothetical protein